MTLCSAPIEKSSIITFSFVYVFCFNRHIISKSIPCQHNYQTNNSLAFICGYNAETRRLLDNVDCKQLIIGSFIVQRSFPSQYPYVIYSISSVEHVQASLGEWTKQCFPLLKAPFQIAWKLVALSEFLSMPENISPSSFKKIEWNAKCSKFISLDRTLKWIDLLFQ